MSRRVILLCGVLEACASTTPPAVAPQQDEAVVLSDAERAALVAALERTRQAVLDRIEGLEEEAFGRRPEAEAWSLKEVVIHLTLAEEQFLESAQEAHAAAPDPAWRDLTEGLGEQIRTIMTDRGRRLNAPPALDPTTGPAVTKDEVVSIFLARRNATIAWARALSGPVRSKLAPHRRFGPMSAEHWLAFIVAHNERHLQQMDALLAPDA